jgi:hypothetical protein
MEASDRAGALVVAVVAASVVVDVASGTLLEVVESMDELVDRGTVVVVPWPARATS